MRNEGSHDLLVLLIPFVRILPLLVPSMSAWGVTTWRTCRGVTSARHVRLRTLITLGRQFAAVKDLATVAPIEALS